jgi:hypothetical protein
VEFVNIIRGVHSLQLQLRFKRLTIKGKRWIYKNEKVKLEMGTKRKIRRSERREYGVYYELEGRNEEDCKVGGRE